MSNGAAQSLSALGMVTFLAYAGVRAGRTIGEALARDGVAGGGARLRPHRRQRRVLVLGVHVPRRLPWLDTAGALAGAQTQPAILAYVNDRPATTPESASPTRSSTRWR